MKKNSLVGSSILFLTAFIWGMAFIAQSVGAGVLDAVSFNAIRYALTTVFLGIVVFVLDFVKKKKGQKVIPFTRDTIVGGCFCGVMLFLATFTQQIGLETTSASKAGFISCLYIVIVPIMGMLARRKAPTISWYAALIAITGFYVMCVSDGFEIATGDLWELLCAFAFSLHIWFVELYSQESDAIKFSFVQFLVSEIVCLPLLAINGLPSPAAVNEALIPLLYMGILSGGVAYTAQVFGQQKVSPEVSTLLMSLESVFALFGGAVILHEQNSVMELLGCLLVFIAVFIAEFSWPRKFLKFTNYKYFNNY